LPTEPTPTRILTPLYGGTFTSDAGLSLPFVLPGELVQPAPELRLLEASPDRATPACLHFGACGGCHYQHATYPAQRALKRQILADLLRSAGIADPPAIQVESAEPLGYRNRIRLRLEPGTDGVVRAGYSRRASNDFLPIRMCPIAAPALWHAAQTILTLQTDPLVLRWLALTAELELFTPPDESKLQLQFFLRTPPPHDLSFSHFCDRLRDAEIRVPPLREAKVGPSKVDPPKLVPPELLGASATLDPELNRRTRRAWPGATWGAAGLNYPAADRPYWVPRGAFFQINRFLIDRLVALVTTGKSGSLAWDLYAGVGLFTRALVESFPHVVAVEGSEAAATALSTHKSQNGKIEAVHAATLDFLRARSLQRERPDLIVLDPPRAGIGPEAAELLARIAARQIVYVSCDPTTLARDLAILAHTYRIQSIHLIDLFPQTFHLETIVHLERRPTPAPKPS
jgi:23S rRNA (uracil1939-C5)-methyltransferase